MASTQYQIYFASVIALAKTMVIKSTAVADAINQDLSSGASGTRSALYTVDLANPASWKYYLNLSGQYHASDTMMSVISQDTLQTINFTVANLSVHTATAAAYQPGTRYYNDLVALYPSQEMLIRGILNPVPIATALAADDGDVLWYDASLVESNEMTLIEEVSTWVKLYRRRWFNGGFADVDDLYLACDLATMYSLLPAVIMGIRLKNCKTYQAHSFHIRMYLAGQGKLDEFVDYLTKPQQLWLYRNIRYLLRNPGRQATFESLVANVLVPRGLPLSDWAMRHNTATLQTDRVPTIEFTRGAITETTADTGAQVRSTTQMLQAEADVAKGNSDQTRWPDVASTLALSTSDRLKTKVLESSVLDMTDASPYTLAHCLINHWLYFASLGQYLSAIQVDNPTTGEIYTFNAADAFVIYVYCYNAAHGIVLDTIPTFYASKVRKLTTPTLAQIQAIVDTGVVDTEDFNAVFQGVPPLARNYLSIESFVTMVNAIHANELYQHALFSTQGHLWKRAYLEQATLFFYQDAVCDLGAGQSYTDWFKGRGLDIPQMSTEDLGTVADAILKQATGQDLASATSLAALQSAMLRLMARLSSYSVQYLASINTSPIIVLERPSIRVGDMNVAGSGSDQIEIPLVDILDESGAGIALYSKLLPEDISTYDWEVSGKAEFDIDLTLRLQGGVNVVTTERIKLNAIGIMAFSDSVDTAAIDDPVTTVADYLPTGLQSLPEAFGNLALPMYGPYAAADVENLQGRYTAYVEAHGLPAPMLAEIIPDRAIETLLVPLPAGPFLDATVPQTDLYPQLEAPAVTALQTLVTARTVDGLIPPNETGNVR